MKLRIALDMPDAAAKPDEAAALAVHALVRLSHGLQYMGCLPTAPVPLWSPDGKIVGRAWTETEEQPADGSVPGL
jgi:hypothetical protein